jgi:hypothetical protein
VVSGQPLLLLISLTEYVRFGLSEIEVQWKADSASAQWTEVWLFTESCIIFFTEQKW